MIWFHLVLHCAPLRGHEQNPHFMTSWLTHCHFVEYGVIRSCPSTLSSSSKNWSLLVFTKAVTSWENQFGPLSFLARFGGCDWTAALGCRLSRGGRATGLAGTALNGGTPIMVPSHAQTHKKSWIFLNHELIAASEHVCCFWRLGSSMKRILTRWKEVSIYLWMEQNDLQLLHHMLQPPISYPWFISCKSHANQVKSLHATR